MEIVGVAYAWGDTWLTGQPAVGYMRTIGHICHCEMPLKEITKQPKPTERLYRATVTNYQLEISLKTVCGWISRKLLYETPSQVDWYGGCLGKNWELDSKWVSKP